MERDQYRALLDKIDGFIRRFYLSKVVRGSIYAGACILAMYLLIFSWIYFAHPGAGVKTAVFFFFLSASAVVIGYWMLRPFLSLLRIGRHLSTEEAATLIGRHFTGVRDKLLNTLQLKQLSELDPQNSRLIAAGIEQRLSELRPVPFYTAVRMRDNRRYLKFLLLPASAILLIALIAPAILREGTTGLIEYDRYIPPKAPFAFRLMNRQLTVMQGSDLELDVALQGSVIPNEVYVQDGINRYKAEKQSLSRFRYTLRNLQQSRTLYFSGGGFTSAGFTVTVILKPTLLHMKARIVYPAYLAKTGRTAEQAGDLEVPEGATVTWEIATEHASRLIFGLDHNTHILEVAGKRASFTALVRHHGQYTVQPLNAANKAGDSISHSIRVIKDQPPEIDIIENTDSSARNAYYFTGSIADDHGFSSLFFKYVIKQNGKTRRSVSHRLRLGPASAQRFFHAWKLDQGQVNPGDVVEYFFEVSDNDGINGAKTVRSIPGVIQVDTESEQKERLRTNSQSLKQKMKAAVNLAAQVEKDTRKLGQSFLDKAQLSSEDRKQISQLLQKQKQLDQAVKEIRELQQQTNAEQNEAMQDADLQEKQRQIEELFNNALDEKTREMLEKLQALIDQNNKERVTQEMSKMQLDNKTVKNELDRILELYKQLEFEQELKSGIETLKDLAKAQEELAAQTGKQSSAPSQLEKAQNQLSGKLSELKKELAELQQKDQRLERPNQFRPPEKEMDDISKSMEESSQALSKNEKEKSAGKQQRAARQMQQLARQMEEMQQESESAENKVNTADLRKLLENLLKASFEQEKVMTALKKMNGNDPAYAAAVQRQRNIKDNMKTVADSLYALSRRVPQIETPVNEEVNKINFNIDKSLESLGERRTAEGNRFQQFAMTSLNTLAVMLNEALEQMQRAQKNASGKGKGKQSAGMQQLARMQEQLNKNMQQAREQMQKSGNAGKVPKGQMSEQFARMAQQQQLIREALQKLNTEKNKDGKGSLGNLNQTINEMKQTENDLVNKRLQQETLMRQKNLLTKLLDAEKAERDQDEEERRESRAGRDIPPGYQKMLEQFRKEHAQAEELIEKAPPGLNSYYRQKLGEYYKLLDLRKK
ncbi:hypothetical protein C7T94_02840 [Pedobacter yulinensis]|uniref:DUF4175 domain-containing protein n=1 Tax=Pedobacter yulinensis TaxID=2126353 RepID=A0A2T3HRQ7_9SPHI|nr:DUF4175 family protein [Pedobacter yulinensis]PST85067.1 hypothetical protein C7T94_02840 [Pedobacter yulinensis]